VALVKPLTDVLLLVAGSLLDPARELVHVAFDFQEVVVGHLGPLLLDFALKLVPFALDLILVHIDLPLLSARGGDGVVRYEIDSSNNCAAKKPLL
jgi:hypothetical protein